MTEISRSKGCCGLYEMYNLGEPPSSEEAARGLIERTMYMNKPSAIIQFTDGGDSDGAITGDHWRDNLVALGYRVDRCRLGVNPKTHNVLYMYHWHTQKKKSPSKVREYVYAQNNKSGSTTRAGTTEGPAKRRGTGYLRSRRGTGT